MNGAVINTGYLCCLSNHDLTPRSLWGRRFEQCSCATSGPLCLPSCCVQFDAWRPRIFSCCLPKVTCSSAKMRYTQHREALLSFPPPTHTHTKTYIHIHTHPMGNHCSAPLSKRCIRDISSLTPGIQFYETRWERFCRSNEVESEINHCTRHVRKGWRRKEIQYFAASVSETKNGTEAPPKSRSGQERWKRKERRATLSKWTCLHLPSSSRGARSLSHERSILCKEFQIKPSMKGWEEWQQCIQPAELNESGTLTVSVDQRWELGGWPVRRNFSLSAVWHW